MQYFFNTSGYNYPKTKQAKVIASLITGNGLALVDGEVHSRQRRIMIPAFHFSTLRAFLPRFQFVAQKTTDKWDGILQKWDGKAVIEMTSWLTKTTLDVMGESKSYSYFGKAMSNTQQLKRIRGYMKEARKVARHIIETASKDHNQGREGAKDIMSILIRANLSENPKTQLDDESLMSQMTTFIFAGHDSTAATTSWALYHLAHHPEAQTRLRNKIRQTKMIAAARGTP
ncbi:hypothetical protein M422DRAFT_263775 [Sphaerobolus stellatus SS14]|uniref:Cytochrome P450 n=1 Tax=Sphaerobolus stellatus (strain SS14) TaxID=990650 RepID=A0A0C9V9Y3_SPHS4|nr:hypothetical protein M422DRAFT_263775 [Sphaerobolus stellatus SS14]